MSKVQPRPALPESITIKPSKIHGLGLFASQDIPKDVELGISHIEDEDAPDGLIRTPLGAFVNHSYSPNADILDNRKEWILITRKEIKSGDEITIDYTPWSGSEVLKTYN